jgi:hypothetical protein
LRVQTDCVTYVKEGNHRVKKAKFVVE